VQYGRQPRTPSVGQAQIEKHDLGPSRITSATAGRLSTAGHHDESVRLECKEAIARNEGGRRTTETVSFSGVPSGRIIARQHPSRRQRSRRPFENARKQTALISSLIRSPSGCSVHALGSEIAGSESLASRCSRTGLVSCARAERRHLYTLRGGLNGRSGRSSGQRRLNSVEVDVGDPPVARLRIMFACSRCDAWLKFAEPGTPIGSGPQWVVRMKFRWV